MLECSGMLFLYYITHAGYSLSYQYWKKCCDNILDEIRHVTVQYFVNNIMATCSETANVHNELSYFHNY